MKRITLFLALNFLITLFISSTILAQAIDINEKSFATPENAITYFLKALIDNDLKKTFKACAINDYSGKYDFNTFSRRLDSVSYLQAMAPSEYDLYTELNKIECLARIGKQIKLFFYSVLSDEDNLLVTKNNLNDGQIEDFVKTVDPAKITGLQIISIDKPSLVDDQRYQKNALASAQCFGANNATERVALLKLHNNFYVLGFHLYQYGSSWKIDSLCSPLANTPMYGVERLSVDQYIF